MNKITISIPLDIYLSKEGKRVVAYSPLVDLTSEGLNEQEAIVSFCEALRISAEIQENNMKV